MRAVEFEISAGWNEIKRAELVIRSATAGLRLIIANTEVINGRQEVLADNVGKKAKAGMIVLGNIRKGERLVLRVPYTAEGDLVELGVKIEVTYTTTKGEFVFASNPTVPVALPLAVNVQDAFKRDV